MLGWYPKMDRSSSHAILFSSELCSSGASSEKFCIFSYIELDANSRNPITVDTSTPYATSGCPPSLCSNHCAGGLIKKKIRVATTSGWITALRCTIARTPTNKTIDILAKVPESTFARLVLFAISIGVAN